MANKIIYADKVGLTAKNTHANQWWDDDANEVKTKHNLNDDRITNLEDNQVTGIVTYQTYADLPGTGTANISYKVENDPTPANNGYYSWVTSAYIKAADLINGSIVSGNIEAVKGGDIYDHLETLNTSQLPSTVLLKLNSATAGTIHGTWASPRTGALEIDLTDLVEGATTAVIWNGNANPAFISAGTYNISGAVTAQGTFVLYIHYINGEFNVNIFKYSQNSGIDSTYYLEFLYARTDNISYQTQFTPTIDFYVEARVRLTDVGNASTSALFGAYDDTLSSGVFRCYFGSDTSQNFLAGFFNTGLGTTAIGFPLNQWHKIKMYYYAATETTNVYLNDVFVGAIPVTAPISHLLEYPIGKYGTAAGDQNAGWDVDWIDINGVRFEMASITNGKVIDSTAVEHTITTDRVDVNDMLKTI